MNVHQLLNSNNPTTPTKKSSVFPIGSADSLLDKFRSTVGLTLQELDTFGIFEAFKRQTRQSDHQAQLYEYAYLMYNAGMKIATYDKSKASVFICEAFLVDERVFVLNPLVVATYQAFATIESIESLVFRAAIFLVQGKFCDAMLTLTALLKQLPDRKSRIFQLRAACYLALGNYLYCLRDLNKSHIHNTHNNQIDFLKAQVFLAMGQWDSAYQSSLKFTTTAHPDDPNLHAQCYNLATLALKLGMGEAVGIVFYNSAKKTEQRYMELNKGRTMTPIPDMKKAALAYFENNLIYSNYKLLFKIQESKLETTLTGMCCQCGQSSAKLSACSACTIVQYCSKGCQYNHWHKHKQDCTKLRQINVK